MGTREFRILIDLCILTCTVILLLAAFGVINL